MCRFHKARVTVRQLAAAGFILLPLGLLGQTSTTITVTSVVPASPLYGQAVTLTASVTPSNAIGQVEFLDGTTVLGVGTVNAAGQAQITTILLASGTRSLQARFGGVPGIWKASQSSVVNLPVHSVANSGFAAAVSASAGINPHSVAVGDFNGDGRADLAVANQGINTVSVLLGNGDGTFALKSSPGTGSNPVSLAVGDFNGDGKTDLAVSNNGGTVSILLGNGDGTFSLKSSPATGICSFSVAVGDFNGDAKADLAVANYGYCTSGVPMPSVSILLGNGDGTFSAATPLTALSAPYSVAIGDFNGDGKTDLAVANYSYPEDNVSILLGNGDGTFSAGPSLGIGSGTPFVAVADFNGDGKADLAVTNLGSDHVSILLGNVDGTFSGAIFAGSGLDPLSVAVGDFNGDDKADLAVAGGNVLNILLGNGNGTFSMSASLGTEVWPFSVAAGDFNGDGRADLAVANYFSRGSNVSIWLGQPPSPVCTFGISQSSVHLDSGSGGFLDGGTSEFMDALSGTFTVNASGCGPNDHWTAISSAQPALAMHAGVFDIGSIPVYSLTGTGAAATTIGYAMFANTTPHTRTATITISGTQGGQPFTLTFTVTQDASPDSQLQRVVRALYQTILGREPDSFGFAFWTGSGAPKDANGVVLVNQMADGFYTSAEFGSNGWEVLSMYRAVLGRLPTFSEWFAGASLLRQPGLVLNLQTFIEAYLDSLTGSISNTTFVQQTIQNAWGRPATSLEVTQYVSQLNSGSQTARLDFLNNTIFTSALFRSATNPAWVSMLYYTILVRDFDPGGFNFWVQGATNPPGQSGIYYVSPSVSAVYNLKLAIIGQAVPPNPAVLGFLGSPEFQGLIQ